MLFDILLTKKSAVIGVTEISSNSVNKMQTPHDIQTPPETPKTQSYDVVRIDEIRTGINAIATSEKLDKESALQVTRLFHGMEMLLRHEINQRDGMIASLRAQLDQQRIQVELDRISSRQIIEDANTGTPRASKFRRV